MLVAICKFRGRYTLAAWSISSHSHKHCMCCRLSAMIDYRILFRHWIIKYAFLSCAIYLPHRKHENLKCEFFWCIAFSFRNNCILAKKILWEPTTPNIVSPFVKHAGHVERVAFTSAVEVLSNSQSQWWRSFFFCAFCPTFGLLKDVFLLQHSIRNL